MDSPVDGFATRAASIPVHGIGLSVDVFSPNLLELYRALADADSPPEYLEIFKAPERELARVHAELSAVPLAYHAEGLWLIDPAMQAATPWEQAVTTIARHAETIGARWANHECAGKQFGGYSFGTYLPPLLTDPAAKAAAANAALAQTALDDWFAKRGRPAAAPLLLLELPPLTYYGFGDLPVAEFFARIAERVPCGLVLDIGHLWTHWRYRERRRFPSLEAFAADFLAGFPMDRVIQIHLAGLGAHEQGRTADGFPFWLDKHDAPVPGVLFDLLRQVLAHPELHALKGIALEVDTKAVSLVVEEFGILVEEPVCRRALAQASRSSAPPSCMGDGVAESVDRDLGELYGAYARVIAGREPLETSPLAQFTADVDRDGLTRYTSRYLPYELLCWGGDLMDLFPSLWAALKSRGVTAEEFVRFWFQRPRSVAGPYDFFYVKLDRWLEFVGAVAPDLAEQAMREAEVLRTLHAGLNDEPAVLESRA